MFNMLRHQGNSNQNNLEISSHPVRKAKIKTQERAGAGEDVEKEEHSSTAGWIACWYNHSGNQSGGSSENRA